MIASKTSFNVAHEMLNITSEVTVTADRDCRIRSTTHTLLITKSRKNGRTCSTRTVIDCQSCVLVTKPKRSRVFSATGKHSIRISSTIVYHRQSILADGAVICDATIDIAVKEVVLAIRKFVRFTVIGRAPSIKAPFHLGWFEVGFVGSRGKQHRVGGDGVANGSINGKKIGVLDNAHHRHGPNGINISTNACYAVNGGTVCQGLV
mmetsp:Transcript_12444/g.22314  ORF Transcript_12444/g.22314 Transcript_12444/m.22314 type:complete len:206 (-) Transcript_12444:36-653(-)